jgi:hypothetical protein
MGMCVCRTICELFTQAFKTATMPGSSSTSTMAVELRAAGTVASWLKFTNQWLGVSQCLYAIQGADPMGVYLC